MSPTRRWLASLVTALALPLFGSGWGARDAGADAGTTGASHDPRCRAFHEANARTYRLLAGCKECTERLHAFVDPVECHADAKGVWGVVIEQTSLRTSSVQGDAPTLASLEVGWRLTRRNDRDGGTASESWARPFVAPGLASDWVNWSIMDLSWGTLTVETPRFFDYDGDGIDEVILSSHAHTEGYSPRAFELWTAVDDAVVRYPNPLTTRIVDIEDVDHDGRPDLLTIEAGADLVSPIGEPRRAGPIVTYHSLPGGTFSGRDGVARALFEKECRPALRTLTAASLPEDDETLVTHLVCARAAGMPARAIRELLEKHRFPDGSTPELPEPADLNDAIDAVPSFVLK